MILGDPLGFFRMIWTIVGLFEGFSGSFASFLPIFMDFSGFSGIFSALTAFFKDLSGFFGILFDSCGFHDEFNGIFFFRIPPLPPHLKLKRLFRDL